MRNQGAIALFVMVLLGSFSAHGACPGDPSNLICNGGFEDGVPATQQIDVFSFTNCPSLVDGWCSSVNSPDLFIRNSVSTSFRVPSNVFAQLCPGGVNTWNWPQPGNDRYVGGYYDGKYVEGVYTKLDQPLVPGQTYRLRFHAMTVKWLGGTVFEDGKILAGFTSAPPTGVISMNSPLDYALPVQTSALCDGTNNWTSFDLTFTAPASPALAYFVVEPVSMAKPGRRHYIYFDDFRLEAAGNGEVAGFKFYDVDADGVFDVGESPLPGWTITITGPNGFSAQTVTDASGGYSFGGLASGTYTIAEVQQGGWVQTFPTGAGTHSVALQTNGLVGGLNFGNRPAAVGGCTPPPANLRAWWTFDDAAGPTSHDRAGADNAGTQIGGPLQVPGRVAAALQFNGTTQYVAVPDAPELDLGTGDLTIDAWVRTTGTGVQSIVDKRSSAAQGYAFFLFDGRLGLQLGDRNVSAICSSSSTAASCTNFIAAPTSTLVNDGNWHLVAATVDRDFAQGGKLYVDGVVVLTFDPTIRPLGLDNTADLHIGRRHITDAAAAELFFSGLLDEVEIAARALSHAEVLAIFNAGPRGKCREACGNPSLIQSDYYTHGNFELVVPHPTAGIQHFWRNNDDPAAPWIPQAVFGTSVGRVDAVSMIQSNFGRNFEVVARIGNQLAHFWRDNSGGPQTWNGPIYFASGVTGTPSLIQSNYYLMGNFEVVSPLASGGIAHYWRNNDDPAYPWKLQAVFGTSEGVFDDVTMIQSNYGKQGNFEVVARIGDRLVHFFRDNDAGQPWNGPLYFASGISGTPSLIQSGYGAQGNFEVAVPLAAGGIVHLTRDNDDVNLPWSIAGVFGHGHQFASVSLIESNYASPEPHFEVVAQLCTGLIHYYRDGSAFDWHETGSIP